MLVVERTKRFFLVGVCMQRRNVVVESRVIEFIASLLLLLLLLLLCA